MFEILRNIKKERHSMQLRMILYLLLMLFFAFTAFVFLGIAFGFFSFTEDRLHDGMQQQLQNLAGEIQDDVERMEGYSHALSQQLGKVIETQAGEYSIDIHRFDNQPEELLELQEKVYPEISSILQLSQASGVFAVVDATTNTQAPQGNLFRSGLYLRLYNIMTDYSLNPKLSFFRGIPKIARERKIELHNRWNMEFDVSSLPGYQSLLEKNYSKPSEGAYWTERIKLPDTWEDILLYVSPITGSDGRVYGACGVEMSALWFRMKHSVYDSCYGSMVLVIAPLSDGVLELNGGLAGEMEGSLVSTGENLSISMKRGFVQYSSPNEKFIGVHTVLPMRGEGGKAWAAAVLMPQSVYADYVVMNRIKWALAAGGLLLIMGVAALFLAKSYIMPIRNSLNAIRNGEGAWSSLGISEIEELLSFVDSKLKESTIDNTGLPPNIAELFDAFEHKVASLTATEHSIFTYYVEGYEIGDIPDLLFISINTVRKHNRNIYEKLNVASKNELMVYVELFQRCGKLDCLLNPKEPREGDKS